MTKVWREERPLEIVILFENTLISPGEDLEIVFTTNTKNTIRLNLELPIDLFASTDSYEISEGKLNFKISTRIPGIYSIKITKIDGQGEYYKIISGENSEIVEGNNPSHKFITIKSKW